MQHLDPDRLVLLALSEEAADTDESVHLAECPGCSAEIDELRHVAELGAETQGLRALPPPPERVWAGIEAATTAPVRRLPQRRQRRWALPVLAAAAAAVLAIAGTVTVQQLTERTEPTPVTARASLSRLGGAPAAAEGAAEVLGGNRLRLDVRNLPLTTGFYEVWLIDPDDTTKMMAMGSLPKDAVDVVFPLPPNADLNRYRLVDVSAEPNDGDAAHSGKSLLRGTLTS
ncbi:anti-sigma factor [Actinoplanes sp. NPDC049599]|uniref:anti-sigma factor n=1 Tax=Actinoplanes sp. NPDC049599 TaxID=3363903 RepID=UPI00378EF680